MLSSGSWWVFCFACRFCERKKRCRHSRDSSGLSSSVRKPFEMPNLSYGTFGSQNAGGKREVAAMKNVFVHPTAQVETGDVGEGTRIWAFAHVLPGAHVGKDCNIGDHCFIEGGARVGDNATVKNGNMLWEGVTLE